MVKRATDERQATTQAWFRWGTLCVQFKLEVEVEVGLQRRGGGPRKDTKGHEM